MMVMICSSGKQFAARRHTPLGNIVSVADAVAIVVHHEAAAAQIEALGTNEQANKRSGLS